MLSAMSLQELRCAISLSMCPPDVLVVFWRILFVHLLLYEFWELLVLNILPHLFILLLILAVHCCLFTLHMVVLCLVLLLGAFPAIHRTTWPTPLPHKQKHILLVMSKICQQPLYHKNDSWTVLQHLPFELYFFLFVEVQWIQSDFKWVSVCRVFIFYKYF